MNASSTRSPGNTEALKEHMYYEFIQTQVLNVLDWMRVLAPEHAHAVPHVYFGL